ncbi:MAG: DNA polymerase IV [Coriobacteriia bacterium]|nr:DNA polymerase IV [Coriobacteriia bacterium]
MDAHNDSWHGRAIIHLDLDAFFASVAQLDNPELRGKPVIVGSPSPRGVVTTCSYEARPYGVHSAMSSVRAQKLCPDAIWVRGDFTRYRELSGQVFDLLRAYTPHVVPTSIDEGYGDITPDTAHTEHPTQVAQRIQEDVARLGITCSIGLASNRTVAKIASDYQKPRGLTVIAPGGEAAFLAPLPIRCLGGIGCKTAAKLEHIGVRTLGDLARLDDTDTQAIFGSLGVTMRDRARGIDPREIRTADPAKSVSNEQTFTSDLTTYADVHRTLTAIADKVTTRLRAKGLAGRTVHVKVRSPNFETHGASRTVTAPLDDITELMPIVEELLPQIWSDGQAVRLLGVGVSNFTDGGEQLSFLETDLTCADADDLACQKELSRNIDQIRAKYGPDALKRGAEI